MPNDQPTDRAWKLCIIVSVSAAAFVLGLSLGLTVLGRWFWAGPYALLPPTQLAALPTPTFATPVPPASATPALLPTATPSATPTATASRVPPIYLTLNVNEYSGYTVYWKRALWQDAIGATPATEDFERDEAEFATLTFPYLTGNGFLLTAQSNAQIISETNSMPSGHFLFYTSDQNGLRLNFPNDTAVRAFGFDYRLYETWHVLVNGLDISLPGGRRGFFGIALSRVYPQSFVLVYQENAQHGLAIDNISYVPAS